MRTVPTHTIVFQSTLSMRRATAVTFYLRVSIVFQSTLSMRRATGHVQRIILRRWISIHALHEESDNSLTWRSVVALNFNPRSP